MTLSDFPSGGVASGKAPALCSVSDCSSPKATQVIRGRAIVRRWCVEHSLIYDQLIKERGPEPVLEGPWKAS